MNEKLTRRPALRRLALLVFGACLAKMDVMHAQGGQLTANLDQWSHIVFTRKGKKIVVSVDEIFEALS
jgi:hypothetical protein